MIGHLFIGLTFNYALRVNLSVAIVAMTDQSINPDFEVSKKNVLINLKRVAAQIGTG